MADGSTVNPRRGRDGRSYWREDVRLEAETRGWYTMIEIVRRTPSDNMTVLRAIRSGDLETIPDPGFVPTGDAYDDPLYIIPLEAGDAWMKTERAEGHPCWEGSTSRIIPG